MIAPALPRWVAEVLADSENGVNALRVLVPRRESDAEPPEVAVFNAVDEDWVARAAPVEGVIPDLWALQINVGEELQIAGSPMSSDPVEDTATIVVLLVGVATDGQNAGALAAAHRIMRAVRSCLNTAFRTLRTDGLQLEGQYFSLPSQLSLLTQEPVPGSGQVALALVIPFTATDTWALGAPET
ncbi:hypothetical protein [Gemmatimonas sp.]|jgi:hypothetical protein|uniref:hypothetical protein n=1 Tax=Gemmatimonas sp. TaxID=1962908 RepID=UPI0037BE6BBB